MQIGLALHNYEMAHECLPPGSVDPNRPIRNQASGYHMSWTVQIAPYIDKSLLFKSVDFSAGVYDPPNTPVRGSSIPLLNCPSHPGGAGALPTYSTYAGAHHHVEAPIDVDNSGVLFLNSSIRYRDIDDGISQTIFAGEVYDIDLLGWCSGTRASLRNGGDWGTAVRAIPVVSSPEASPTGPLKNEGKKVPDELLLKVGGFGSYHGGGAHFVFGDGNVRFLNSSIPAKMFQNLIHRRDGELPGRY
jgi:Protein of unknown function (DUF1559)